MYVCLFQDKFLISQIKKKFLVFANKKYIKACFDHEKEKT